jgi:predicted nucleotidyltransferase
LRDDSDIDLAVTGLPARVFFKAVAEASRIVGRSVDVVELDRGGEVADALRRFEGLELVL